MPKFRARPILKSMAYSMSCRAAMKYRPSGNGDCKGASSGSLRCVVIRRHSARGFHRVTTSRPAEGAPAWEIGTTCPSHLKLQADTFAIFCFRQGYAAMRLPILTSGPAVTASRGAAQPQMKPSASSACSTLMSRAGRIAISDRNPAIIKRFWNTVTPAAIKGASASPKVAPIVTSAVRL